MEGGGELVNRWSSMKYEAVIFDLGGTLVPIFPWSEFQNSAKKMALVLSVPEEEYLQLWFAQSSGLGTGEFKSYQDFIRHICKQLEINVSEERIETAASIPFKMMQRMVAFPREDAIEVLSGLKKNGYKLGLVSDCGTDVPEIWSDTPFAPFFDVTVFSCFVGMNKDDPRIFQLAFEEMKVNPGDCLYIADGFRQELANASKLGMHALQIRVPAEIDDSPLREKWDGPVITSLKEVLDLVK